jgi:hypothetical protein
VNAIGREHVVIVRIRAHAEQNQSAGGGSFEEIRRFIDEVRSVGEGAALALLQLESILHDAQIWTIRGIGFIRVRENEAVRTRWLPGCRVKSASVSALFA